MTRFRLTPPPPLLLLLLLLPLLIFSATSQQPIEQNLERDAIFQLKASLNNSFLNTNWTGPQCPSDDFPDKWSGIECNVDGRVTGISLPSMGLAGPLISRGSFLAFSELTTLVLRNNSLTGRIMDFSSNQKIQQIDLSHNRLHGPIPVSMVRLLSLQSLLLQNNFLTGTIPAFNQSTLNSFNVSNNDIAEAIPATERLKSFGADSFANNPKLCGPQASHPCVSVTENETMSSFVIMFLLFDIAGLIAVILLFALYCKKARRLERMYQKDSTEKGTPVSTSFESESTVEIHHREPDDHHPKIETAAAVEVEVEKGEKLGGEEEEARFQLTDLLQASAEGLGKGTFGNTYRAKMEGGSISSVVVKRLRDLRPLTSDELTKQLHFIGDQKHSNLLPPLAYYISQDEKLLVSRFAENGNLFNRIHGGRGTKDRIPFRWSARLTVAQGVARGMAYLHRNTTTKAAAESGGIPHGNLTSTNVLLDENERALVADYGFIPLLAVPIAHQAMICYRSPEYQNSKKVSRKTDVWSYGGLLLELLTGRVSTYSAENGGGRVDLWNWVYRAVREEWTCEVLDAEIGVQRNGVPGMLKLLQLAMRCCEKSPEKRPEMAEVLKEVEGIKAVGESEDEEDLSMEQSLEDESISTTTTSANGG
ncbi:unnamed protein product [Linum tenue]|uniref:Protein kinase domain-containing protein n=1 Tax=Linum tenue TaxID=586396 RepID=A0AAV0JRD3_9ROSI|nr:unnamed protein product [Linum tenue]